jgi:soluble P-type ATPase
MRRHWAELFLRDSQLEGKNRGGLKIEAHTLRVRGSVARSGALLRQVSVGDSEGGIQEDLRASTLSVGTGASLSLAMRRATMYVDDGVC